MRRPHARSTPPGGGKDEDGGAGRRKSGRGWERVADAYLCRRGTRKSGALSVAFACEPLRRAVAVHLVAHALRTRRNTRRAPAGSPSTPRSAKGPSRRRSSSRMSRETAPPGPPSPPRAADRYRKRRGRVVSLSLSLTLRGPETRRTALVVVVAVAPLSRETGVTPGSRGTVSSRLCAVKLARKERLHAPFRPAQTARRRKEENGKRNTRGLLSSRALIPRRNNRELTSSSRVLEWRLETLSPGQWGLISAPWNSCGNSRRGEWSRRGSCCWSSFSGPPAVRVSTSQSSCVRYAR